MHRLKMVVVLLLTISGGFFSTGCSAAQRKELLDEALLNAKDFGINTLAPQVRAYVDTKLAEQKTKQYAVIDAQLMAVKTVDSETNLPVIKTWKDFDADKDGDLNVTELATVSKYVVDTSSKLVAEGKMSKDDASKTVKATVGAAGILALLALASKLVKKAPIPAAPPPAPVA